MSLEVSIILLHHFHSFSLCILENQSPSPQRIFTDRNPFAYGGARLRITSDFPAESKQATK
jgi:hypothetical protein